MSYFRGSSRPRDQTCMSCVSCTGRGSLTTSSSWWACQENNVTLICWGWGQEFNKQGFACSPQHCLRQRWLTTSRALLASVSLEKEAPSALLAQWHSSLRWPILIRVTTSRVDCPTGVTVHWPNYGFCSTHSDIINSLVDFLFLCQSPGHLLNISRFHNPKYFWTHTYTQIHIYGTGKAKSILKVCHSISRYHKPVKSCFSYDNCILSKSEPHILREKTNKI